MPKLDLQSVHEFWKNYEDPIIYRVLSFMESVEKQTLDGNPDIETGLEKLGNALEGLTKFDLDHEDHYVKILSQLKMTRVLRLMQAVDTIHPGSASRLLMYAEEKNENADDPASLFIKRNIVFERLRLLSRVFSPERLQLVSKALEHEDEA
jgi:intracellular multiplication protein IcmW